ncbi:MAG: chromosome segregation SMC family protein [Solirubrobacterales bacterium]
MHLSSITIKGFKSFPERTRLVFSPGVSVIVGPNGCGKSNITDAVLWALGEQSPLAVRGQSMGDMIFAGGDGRGPSRYAEVEVVLAPDEADEAGPQAGHFSEIAVRRRHERGGDGGYWMNGARCRLTDVVESLSDASLGREMHSVISQGRVEEIVHSRPRDRRLLVEEAAGLGKHRKRRRRAQLKLERTQDNLDRALDVEREARSRLRPLKRQAQAAEIHARIERDADELRARLLAAQLGGHGEGLDAAEAAAATARTARDEIEQELAGVNARRAAAEERLAARDRERTQAWGRLTAIRAAHERLTVRAEALASSRTRLAAELDRRRAALGALADAVAAPDRAAVVDAGLERIGAALAQAGEVHAQALGGEGSGRAAAVGRVRAAAERAAGDARRVEDALDRGRQETLRSQITERADLVAALGGLCEALADVRDAAGERAGTLEASMLSQGGSDEVADELRACSKLDAELQTKLRTVADQVTSAEVEAAHLRERRDESEAELARIAERLGRGIGPSAEPISDAERGEIANKLERLGRRREQLGPVNPLAEREYEEAVAHVTELEEQRGDLEGALAELQVLIRETDRRIEEAFEETFEAAQQNFSELVEHLFPGGRGRLRLVAERGPRQVLGGAEAPGEGEVAAEEAPDDEGSGEEFSGQGVEIEVTPAGKATRRLSLLSGGEKSLVALAFVFSVFLARPSPFYILDEVEAALDDANIDRFLQLVQRFADRAQFIIVTHQKRTMDAADVLYGVSMGSGGVTKVISRRMPQEGEGRQVQLAPAASQPEAA